ncbi:MAG: hypothetical protein K2P09_02420 [Erysipelotrichales bacterium]|nr:hypothetical protein [Erysipelotrichales bacterium]
MFNQSCGCQAHNTNMNQSCQGMTQNYQNMAQGQTCGCGINGCPRPQPLVAPKRVCITNQITPVPQPVICPIECRRVNRCVNYPVFYPQYEQTFMNVPCNQFY